MPDQSLTSSNSHFSVAIVGGGFSGTLLAIQLLRKAERPISISVIERQPARGRGVAYSTLYGWHLLNVPAGKMSAFPDDPGHFLRWAQHNYDSFADEKSFLPRRVFGQYIESLLRETTAIHGERLQWIADEASHIARDRDLTTLFLRKGGRLTANKVVLALGNFPPSDPSLPGKSVSSPRYKPYAWAPSALEGVAAEQSILLVGAGLTSVDIAVALRAAEFRGAIHVLSRRGLLPERHRPAAPWPAFWNEDSPRTALGLLRLVRRQVEAARRQDVDWRGVIDSLRPFTHRIWQSLNHTEKRRFLRHLRPYWEVVRHRVAPEIGGLIGYQLVCGSLQLHAGRIQQYAEDSSGVQITYRERRSGQQRSFRVDRVINCTGPETDCRKLDDPLIRNLWLQKFARPDPLFLGLDVTAEGTLIDATGQPSDFLYAIGPARKGTLWETTAVPEIRQQAADLAELVIASSQGTGYGHADQLPLPEFPLNSD